MLVHTLDNLSIGYYIRRLNRFVVQVRIGNKVYKAHLTNTGRLHDLLVAGRRLILGQINGKKLKYRVISVEDISGYAIIDTITQNRIFELFIKRNILPYFYDCNIVKRNPRIDSEVFDYIIRCNDTDNIIETKSAVLRNRHRAMYPDCPSVRGRRQIRKLIELSKMGLKTWLIFISALPKIKCFMPYMEGDPVIFNLVSKAVRSGVRVKAISLYMNEKGKIYLENPDLKLCKEWINNII